MDKGQRTLGETAFTIFELLIVMGIIVIMVSLMAPATNSFMRRTQVESEAKRLASLLRSARQYALENSAHTRVVFADAELEEFTDGQFKANEAYAAYTFFKPTLPSGGSDYLPISEGKNGYSAEFASMPFTSIPSGFVGQFVPLPGSESWRKLKPTITMVGFVPEQADLIDADYSREFFDKSNLLVKTEIEESEGRERRFISPFYYNPSKYWDAEGSTFYLSNIPNSLYPQNYFQTPFPIAYPIINTRIMPEEPSNFVAKEKIYTYKELWSSPAELEYFDEIEDHLDSYKNLGEPDTKSPTDETKMFFNLKGIEFSPKGLPTLKWADEVVFQFRPKTGRPSPAYDVIISRNTGLASVRLARKPHIVESESEAGGEDEEAEGTGSETATN